MTRWQSSAAVRFVIGAALALTVTCGESRAQAPAPPVFPAAPTLHGIAPAAPGAGAMAQRGQRRGRRHGHRRGRDRGRARSSPQR
jgi:hypothetical protein